MTGRTYLLLETDDARRYERLCELSSEAQRQYVKVILRGRRDPSDFRRMLELNSMLRDQLELIDRQCNDILKQHRGTHDR